MQPSSSPDDQLNLIEQRLSEAEELIQRQNATLNHIRQRMIGAARSDEWYSVQFSELFRIITRDIRELRTALVWSVVSETPVSAELLQHLLWAANQGDDEPPRFPPHQ